VDQFPLKNEELIINSVVKTSAKKFPVFPTQAPTPPSADFLPLKQQSLHWWRVVEPSPLFKADQVIALWSTWWTPSNSFWLHSIHKTDTISACQAFCAWSAWNESM